MDEIIEIEGLPIEGDYTDCALTILNHLQETLPPRAFESIYPELEEVIVANQP